MCKTVQEPHESLCKLYTTNNVVVIVESAIYDPNSYFKQYKRRDSKHTITILT